MAKAKTKKNKIGAVLNSTNTENPSQKDKDNLAVILQDSQFVAEANHFGRQIHMRLLRDITPGSYFVNKATEAKVESMQDELGYQTSTIAEKLLIDEILINWLKLKKVQEDHTARLSGSHERASGGYWDRRLTAANNRFMKSLLTLAKVRKLIGATQAHAVKLYEQIAKE